jgi:TonB-dependent receptor
MSNRLRLTGGVRAEQTNIDAAGPLEDPTLNYRRDANGNVIRVNNVIQLIEPAGTLAAWQRVLLDRGTPVKKEYLRLFPSINASYDLRDGLIARLSYSESVGRPDFNQYMGGVLLPDIENLNPNARITVNNASIKAWQAKTYMARVEYYFGTVGTLSLSGFIRDYTNFFVNVTSPVSAQFLETYGLDEDTYGGIQVITQFNNPDNVRQHGFEIDYKQSLTFLPNWARGVQVFANFSSQRAKDTDNMQDMNPFVLNWGISLNRPKWNIRINENYRGIQRRAFVAPAFTNGVVTNSIEPGTYNYRPKRLYIDISGEYYLSRSLGLFASIRNLNGATEDTKIYGPNTPAYAKFRQRDDYGGSLWTAGIKGSF